MEATHMIKAKIWYFVSSTETPDIKKIREDLIRKLDPVFEDSLENIEDIEIEKC